MFFEWLVIEPEYATFITPDGREEYVDKCLSGELVPQCRLKPTDIRLAITGIPNWVANYGEGITPAERVYLNMKGNKHVGKEMGY